MTDNTIYQFNVKKLNGEEISLSDYKDKVLLIVNTASECGFTPQIDDLIELKKELEGKNFEILTFPSNDFGAQEPLDGASLSAFCEIKHVNYPVFEKIRVRGPYADPLYKFFAEKKQNGKFQSVPRWNFHKFLIDRQGIVSDFYFPFTKPTSSKIKKRINRLLSAS
jgi:glutathione peroxidase